jgi:hypothetical protein
MLLSFCRVNVFTASCASCLLVCGAYVAVCCCHCRSFSDGLAFTRTSRVSRCCATKRLPQPRSEQWSGGTGLASVCTCSAYQPTEDNLSSA